MKEIKCIEGTIVDVECAGGDELIGCIGHASSPANGRIEQLVPVLTQELAEARAESRRRASHSRVGSPKQLGACGSQPGAVDSPPAETGVPQCESSNTLGR